MDSLILTREEKMDIVELMQFCEQLREQARARIRTSAAVNTLEWKAARIIEALVNGPQ